ncbi:MAG: GH25 family lysozyme [Lachnospiraceae bacterium]
MSNISYKTIDISHHNTITNWSELAKEINTIIIRLGYISYTNGKFVTDKKFESYITTALANNMNIGIYVWDQSINEKEASDFADYCAAKLKPYPIKLPVYLDSEYYNAKREGRADYLSAANRTKNIIAFCERIKQHGYTPGVYASNSWFQTQVNFNALKNYEIWCARYSTDKPTIGKYEAWQYGSEIFSWAKGPIDVNLFYKKYDKTIAIQPALKKTNVKITATLLNIRSTPTSVKSSNIVGTYKKGTIVTITGETNTGWYSTKDGYIYKKYTTLI